MAGLGRYGPYLLHDGKYAKLTGTAEIFDIGMNAAVVRIAEAAEGGGRGRTKAEPLNTFGPPPTRGEIGRAHVCTPVNNAHLVCRLLLEKKHTHRKQREN